VIELLRYSLVTLTAAVMSVICSQMMFHFPALWEFDHASFGLILPSILLWAVLVWPIRRMEWWGAVAVGLISPVIGGFLLGGPTGLGIVLSEWPITFPTGAVTGFLIHRSLFLGRLE